MDNLDGLITSDVDGRSVLLHQPCMVDGWERRSVHAPLTSITVNLRLRWNATANGQGQRLQQVTAQWLKTWRNRSVVPAPGACGWRRRLERALPSTFTF